MTPADGAFGPSGAPPQHTFYDAHAQYRSPSSEYHPPAHWFDDVHVRPTPPLRIDGSRRGMPAGQELPEEFSDDTDRLSEPGPETRVSAEPEQDPIHHRMIVELRGDVAFRESGDAGEESPEMHSINVEPAPEPDPFANHPWYGTPEMTQAAFEEAMHEASQPDLFDTPMAEAADPFEAMQAECEPEPEQSLEALVEQAVPEPEELEEDPWQLHDQQMQQMMNPWMMPGFGPGP